MDKKIIKTDEEWKKELTPEQYRILREKGTEVPFTGEYNKSKANGVYRCAACGNPLFSSEAKFDSGTGWPSFYKTISNENVEKEKDITIGIERTEVKCNRCGGHLGHIFDDSALLIINHEQGRRIDDSALLIINHEQGRRIDDSALLIINPEQGRRIDDGPEPTGQRFCINSMALKLDPKEK